MKRWIVLMIVSLLTLTVLAGCGCMGCGRNNPDYADDGVVDGSAGNGTDGVTGGDTYNNGTGIIDDARNAVDDFVGGVGNAVDDITGDNYNGNARNGYNDNAVNDYNGNARNGYDNTYTNGYNNGYNNDMNGVTTTTTTTHHGK